MKLQDCTLLSRFSKAVLVASIFLFPIALVAQTSTFVSFDAPGAAGQGTFAVGINRSGVVAGFYTDSSNAFHGFVREANGVINEVVVPGLTSIKVSGINDAGQVVGSGNLTAKPFTAKGFVVNGDGTSTTFSVVGAGGFFANGINNQGEVTGYYSGSDNRVHSYIRDASGKITTFDNPEATKATGNGTFAWAINDRGQAAGFYNSDANTGVNRAFVRDRFGKFTNFDVSPAGGAIEIGIGGISASGEVVGQYFGSDFIQYAFIRDASGNLTDFSIQGSQLNAATGVNGTGQVVGTWEEPTTPFSGFAFLRNAAGNVRSYTAPYPNVSTNPAGINAGGTTTGSWTDLNFVSHGFIR